MRLIQSVIFVYKHIIYRTKYLDKIIYYTISQMSDYSTMSMYAS